MEGKIEENAEAIGSEKSQLRYIYAKLEKIAKTNIITFYELELRKPNSSFSDFIH
jgi:hypothetical protein